MPDAVPAPATPSFPPPPAAFNLAWEDRGIVGTRRGQRWLHVASPTPAFADAWRSTAASSLLRGVGYTVEADHLWEPRLVKHWGDGTLVDPAVLVEAERLGAASGERRRLAAEERRRVIADRTARVHADLASTLADAGWAMSASSVIAARDLLATQGLVEWQWETAEGIVRRARQAVERAAVAVAAEAAAAAEQDLAACAAPEVRDAVLAGCRYLSDLDDDHATAANRIGWSQSTTRAGHTLAREERLDAGRAVVGLRLLRHHRRQVPDDLRGVLGIPA